MPRFAANLTMLFNEVPFLERFERAARAGLAAVEFLFPYEHEPEVIRELLDQHGLQLVLHNLPAGDWARGDRGIACDPRREDEFRDGVARAIRYALALGVPQLNCLCGKTPAGTSAELSHRTLVNNLRFAARQLDEVGVKLLVEPINTFDIPGFSLSTTAQAIALIDEVANPNLYLQFDIYHAQRMEGELANRLQQLLPRIAHVQLADNPGRGEPGTGEINYPFLFAHLDRIGYAGWVGCEYKPTRQTELTLEWRA
ncbi:hydroxypyruvate isomerase [Ramlibacter albus]|uniref:Hydroxypyruvate isomerase n=1 Tax=Ramlibacter albus TaxID=2079448 RepID=A0A923MFX0_9BURK|nr:hydroxypyruvate isomerase [Ramlibacter albus]MBC5768524.1 hydroxypyruvate isomerase [Ramlibacter albus]